jgi:hypothetical protein
MFIFYTGKASQWRPFLGWCGINMEE